MLNDIFSTYPGFREVRHIPERQVSFVEYDADDHAGMALQALNGYSNKENNGETTILRISFAKR